MLLEIFLFCFIKTIGHTVTIIIVVCVGFLVFMIILGVIRIRAAHQRAQETKDEDQEMAWDDSSLTITVNPMDVSMKILIVVYRVNLLIDYIWVDEIQC